RKGIRYRQRQLDSRLRGEEDRQSGAAGSGPAGDSGCGRHRVVHRDGGSCPGRGVIGKNPRAATVARPRTLILKNAATRERALNTEKRECTGYRFRFREGGTGGPGNDLS